MSRGRAIRRTIASAVVCLWGCVPLIAPAQTANWPGQAWFQLRYPSSPQPEERKDLILRAVAQQGARLVDIGPRAGLHAKSRLAIVRDSERLSYNNKAIASLGLELQASPTRSLTLMAGVRQEWEHRFISDKTSSELVSYVGWSLWKELGSKQREQGSKTMILSSWGEARFPSAPDPEERDNAIVEGAVELAAPVANLGGKGATLFATASVDFKADTVGLDYNNQFSPAAGLKIQMPLGRSLGAEIGARYVADYRFYSDRFHHGPAIWIGASARW